MVAEIENFPELKSNGLEISIPAGCVSDKTGKTNSRYDNNDYIAYTTEFKISNREYSVEVKEQNGAMLASQEGLLPMFGAQSEVNNSNRKGADGSAPFN